MGEALASNTGSMMGTAILDVPWEFKHEKKFDAFALTAAAAFTEAAVSREDLPAR